MDGEAEAHRLSPRGRQRSSRGFVEEAGSGAEEWSTETPQEDLNGLLNNQIEHNGCSESDPESSGPPAYPVWTMTGDERNIQDSLFRSWCTAEGSVVQISPALEYWVCLDNQHRVEDCHVSAAVSPSDSLFLDRPYQPAALQSSATAATGPEVSSFICDAGSPTGFPCSPTTGPTWEGLRCSSSSSRSSDQDPVSAAAHLHLLGESLSLIGRHLQETNKTVCMSGSFSLLLDSLLCALAPLMCLTTQIPELSSCTELASTLENISYLMPGL